MIFSSFTFIFLFLPAFWLVYLFAPKRFRNLVILVFSWIFYAWWRLDFLPLLIFISLWAWLVGLMLRRRSKSSKSTLIVGVTVLLAALGWFKYANLFVGTLTGFGLRIEGWHHLLLPIGLSFFTFGAISYVVDVYRGNVDAEPNFITYAAYQAVFPHLVAGPIIRYASIAKELHERSFDLSQFRAGVERFSLAFAQKILLADTLAPLVNTGFALSKPSMADAWLATLGYALQLYLDFSAYSSMAIGLGLMMGLPFPENFNNPYWSRSVTEFWRRWHITLSNWLRDYLYIPLGGNRSGTFRTYVNLLVTMGLGGLWHGASWTFLIWGLWQGTGLAVERAWKNLRLPQPSAGLGFALTATFVLLGWTLFRANDAQTALKMFRAMFGFGALPLTSAYLAAIRPIELFALVFGLVVVYAPLIRLPSAFRQVSFRAGLSYGAVAVFVFTCWALKGRSVVPFLYFQF